MKNLFLFIFFCMSLNFKAQQIYSLRPAEIDLPENSYQKDTNNELPAYEGTWKGTWDNKIIYITLKKIINKYDNDFKHYRDYLVGKFKVTKLNGTVLYNDTLFADGYAKIVGVSFRRYGDKYSLVYIDSDLCNTTGSIAINFIDNSKTQLNWKLNLDSNMITTDCQYYNTGIPQVLPKEIILTKQ